MAKKIDAKEIGISLTMGTGTVLGSMLFAGIVSGFPFMTTTVIPAVGGASIITVGAIIGAGLSAFGINLMIDKYWR